MNPGIEYPNSMPDDAVLFVDRGKGGKARLHQIKLETAHKHLRSGGFPVVMKLLIEESSAMHAGLLTDETSSIYAKINTRSGKRVARIHLTGRHNNKVLYEGSHSNLALFYCYDALSTRIKGHVSLVTPQDWREPGSKWPKDVVFYRMEWRRREYLTRYLNISQAIDDLCRIRDTGSREVVHMKLRHRSDEFQLSYRYSDYEHCIDALSHGVNAGIGKPTSNVLEVLERAYLELRRHNFVGELVSDPVVPIDLDEEYPLEWNPERWI